MKRNINLFTTFYADANSDRYNELAECLLRNAANSYINRIVLLNNPRPTYREFFEQTQQFPDDINIIANSDIYFDDSLKLLNEIEFRPENCFALTRWEVSENGKMYERTIDRGSQDAWVFFGAVKNFEKHQTSFCLGIPGCDNRIAYELQEMGYKLFNPSQSIRILHLHNSGIRNYDAKRVIGGKHLLLESTSLENMERETKRYEILYEGKEVIPETEFSERLLFTGTEKTDNPKAATGDRVFNVEVFPKRGRSGAISGPIANDPVRVLHIALCPGENGLTRALKKLGPYEEIDFGKVVRDFGKSIKETDFKRILKTGGQLFINQFIIETFNRFQPELVFMQLQTDDLVTPETCRYMSDKAFVMNWGGDKRDPLPSYFADLKGDVTVTGCVCEDDVWKIRKMGNKAEFLQIGFDPEIYRPGLKLLPETPDVVFLANNPGTFPLSAERAALVSFLKIELGENFQVRGNGWGYPNSLPADQHTEARVYNSCKIAINFSHFDSSRYTSDRLFRILGSGAFCLSHHYPGIERDFKPGTHLDTFRNFHELLEKIRFYMTVDATRNRIAAQGRELAHNNYTFDHMAQNIYKIYKNYNGSKTKLGAEPRRGEA